MAVTSRQPEPVPVIVAAGAGGATVRHRLRADHRVDLVRSPRHACLLVIAGDVPGSDRAPLLQLHDQVPRPRGVIAAGARGLPAELDPVTCAADDVVGAVLDAGRAVLGGERDHDDVLPATNPVPWRGVGPHGQGGEGMMGGMPYGRAMPMTADGRDGLALDRLPLTLGPWLAGLPSGCRLEIGLQGDVLEEASVRYAATGPTLAGPVSVAEVETLRARTLLGWLADLVDSAGLPALARRCSRVALDPTPDGVHALRRRLDRRWGLPVATDGVGALDVQDVAGQGLGWLARSRGVDEDARRGDPAYADLDLAAPTDRGADVTARWRTWLDEAGEALRLAAAAGQRRTERPELPWGPASTGREDRAAVHGRLASQLVVGAEIGRALLTLASLPTACDAGFAASRQEAAA